MGMQLTRKGIALLVGIMILAGSLGAVGTIYGIAEYRRYQALLATVDALVALAQQNIKDGKIEPLAK